MIFEEQVLARVFDGENPLPVDGLLFNFFGGLSLPLINDVCNGLTGFDRTTVDPQWQQARNVYPGDFFCRLTEGHTKWHELSGNAFLDTVFVGNAAASVIKGESLRRSADQEDDEFGGAFVECAYDSILQTAEDRSTMKSANETDFWGVLDEMIGPCLTLLPV